MCEKIFSKRANMNFMIIRRFLMYFADFRAKFCVF